MRVTLDIKPILVMINNGNFIGYDKILDKTGDLAKIKPHELYKDGKYEELIRYIKEEAEVFLKAYRIFKREMPSLAKHL